MLAIYGSLCACSALSQRQLSAKQRQLVHTSRGRSFIDPPLQVEMRHCHNRSCKPLPSFDSGLDGFTADRSRPLGGKATIQHFHLHIFYLTRGPRIPCSRVATKMRWKLRKVAPKNTACNVKSRAARCHIFQCQKKLWGALVCILKETLFPVAWSVFSRKDGLGAPWSAFLKERLNPPTCYFPIPKTGFGGAMVCILWTRPNVNCPRPKRLLGNPQQWHTNM